MSPWSLQGPVRPNLVRWGSWVPGRSSGDPVLALTFHPTPTFCSAAHPARLQLRGAASLAPLEASLAWGCPFWGSGCPAWGCLLCPLSLTLALGLCPCP